MKLCFIGDAGHTNLTSWIKCLRDVLRDEMHVLTFRPPCEYAGGINFHVLSLPFINNRLRYVLAIPQVRKRVQLIRPDIIVGYRLNSYGFMAVTAGFHPVVGISQGSDIFYPKKSLFNHFFVKYVIRRADLIHVWGRHMSDRLVEYGVDTNKLFTLPKGINTEIFKPSVEKQKSCTFVLISTRQLRRSYNHICILNALALVLETFPNLQYFMCGDGEYRKTLENHVKRLGIDKNVEFFGRVEHDMLPSLLASSDVYVSMQSSDGVSASLLEAMACGVFPIVTDIEANRLWIEHGVNGYLVPVNDHAALADGIIRVINEPELRQAARRINVRTMPQNASMEHNARETIKMYSTLLEKHKQNILQ